MSAPRAHVPPLTPLSRARKALRSGAVLAAVLVILTTPAVGRAGHIPGHVDLPATLNQLLQRGAFAIVDDKRFENFNFLGDLGNVPINPATIPVSAISFPDPGLLFGNPLGPPIVTVGPGQLALFSLTFDVAVIDPSTGLRIHDNTLEIGVPPVIPNGFAQILENVFDPDGNLLAQKLVFSDLIGSQLVDQATFPPQERIHVQKAGVVGAVTDTVSLQSFSQTFSQVKVAPIPEPGTLALLGVGVAGLLGYGWRRRRLGA